MSRPLQVPLLLAAGVVLGAAGIGWLSSPAPHGAPRAVTSRASDAGSEPRGEARPGPHAAAPPTLSCDADLRAWLDRTRSAAPSDVAELTRAALTSPEVSVAANALRALGRLGHVTAESPLAAMLGDARVRVRQECVRGLGFSADPSAVELLLEALRREDPALTPLALQALGRLGGERARAILEGVRDSAEASDLERTFARAGLAGA